MQQLEHKLADNTVVVCPIPRLDFTSKAQLMADLMVLAFQRDMTRVQTFMLGNDAPNRRYDFLGINQGHHEISQ